MTSDPLSPAGTALPSESVPTTVQPVRDRGSNRARRPSSDGFRSFIASGWAPRQVARVTPGRAAPYTSARRAALSARFPGDLLVVPAGPLRTRSNDTDYRFRPHSAFAHLTGLGTDREPDAVLVLHPVERADGTDRHEAVLYVRPLAGRDTEEFYADARYGEFWVGARPSLADVTMHTGIRAAHIDDLPARLAHDVEVGGARLRVVPGSDSATEILVESLRLLRLEAPETADASQEAASDDEELAEALSELRLVKDAFEVAELREAVAATIDGFGHVVRELPRAAAHRRGERVVETTFDAHARLEGNAVGYETIAASGEHATTLHWIRNDGAVRDGDLLLLDAGVEVESLYTADITRTLPVNGTFSEVQRRVYTAVLDAADAAFGAARPGARFSDVHDAAMEVIADRLAGWGLLPGTAAESLAPEGQFHRRWMVHGTSHHLGLDVHDCAQARREMYLDARLEPGMVFTIEPGLYFKSDDLTVPEELRGIGVRIEDDVLITEDGNENLSAALPRRAQDVEAWMAQLRA